MTKEGSSEKVLPRGGNDDSKEDKEGKGGDEGGIEEVKRSQMNCSTGKLLSQEEDKEKGSQRSKDNDPSPADKGADEGNTGAEEPKGGGEEEDNKCEYDKEDDA